MLIERSVTESLTTAAAARQRGVEYLLAQMRDDGAIGPAEERVFYYRVPWAFAVSGETAAAMSVLEWIRRHALTADGEVAEPAHATRSMLATTNTYAETNVAYGAHLLRRYDIAQSTMRFALRFQDAQNGGAFLDRHRTGADGPQLLFLTSQLGMSALLTGHVDAALAAGRWFARLWATQPELPERLYTIQTSAGGLATTIPDESQRRHYVNEAHDVKQYHYNGGIAAAFLSRLYMQTADSEWLALARAFQRFSMESTDGQFETKQVCKSAWGAGLLAVITGEPLYRDWTVRMADWFASEQEADGSWVNTPYLSPQPSVADRIEITAEFVVHLDTILGALAATSVR